MTIVRVQVGISRELQAKLEAGSVTVADFARAIGLDRADTSRLKDFGLLIGEMDEARIEEIRRRTGVDFVAEDRSRVTL